MSTNTVVFMGSGKDVGEIVTLVLMFPPNLSKQSSRGETDFAIRQACKTSADG